MIFRIEANCLYHKISVDYVTRTLDRLRNLAPGCIWWHPNACVEFRTPRTRLRPHRRLEMPAAPTARRIRRPSSSACDTSRRRARHVVAVATIQTLDRSRALANGCAHAVHCCVTTANDNDVLTIGNEVVIVWNVVAQAPAIACDQVVKGLHDAAQSDARHGHSALPYMRPTQREVHVVPLERNSAKVASLADFELERKLNLSLLPASRPDASTRCFSSLKLGMP